MRIGLDMMGGDFAPDEAVRGVLDFLTLPEAESVTCVLFGDSTRIQELLAKHQVSANKIDIIPTDEIIGMHEHPTKALKEKTNSSIAVGFGHLHAGKIDAFISAGNTGAMLVGALFSIKAIEGVLRPTISSVLPKTDGGTGLLLDVGLNADCKPEQLNQFAVMGSVYAQQILGIETPRVALLNVGEEEGKGNVLCQATYPLLKANSQIHFVGNIEGRDLFSDKADVVVTEGFTGNVVLKLAESLFEITQSKKVTHPYFERFNFEYYGGTPILGVNKPIIIGHGISTHISFANMIKVAQKMVEKNVLRKMEESLKNV